MLSKSRLYNCFDENICKYVFENNWFKSVFSSFAFHFQRLR